jgi:hypothetical protein
MTITKKTKLVNVESSDNGTLFLPLRLSVLDGDVEIAARTHRFSIEPTADFDLDTDVETLNNALANLDGEGVGYPALSESDQAKVQRMIDDEWTPEVIAAAEQRRKEAAEKAEAMQKAQAATPEPETATQE